METYESQESQCRGIFIYFELFVQATFTSSAYWFKQHLSTTSSLVPGAAQVLFYSVPSTHSSLVPHAGFVLVIRCLTMVSSLTVDIDIRSFQFATWKEQTEVPKRVVYPAVRPNDLNI